MAETYTPPATVTLVNAAGTRIRVAATLAPKMRGYRPAGTTTATSEGEPSEAWTLSQLRDHATVHNIDLGGATRKADIVAAINAASEPDDS